jgi:hypothetical protein
MARFHQALIHPFQNFIRTLNQQAHHPSLFISLILLLFNFGPPHFLSLKLMHMKALLFRFI